MVTLGTNKNKAKEVTDGASCRIPLAPEERAVTIEAGNVPKMSDITWRIFRIMAEFVEGFQFLSSLQREVTIFGSARLPATNKWYQEAEKLGRLLSENDFIVVTGGGPGIMEGANKGAFDTGGISVGLNIQLPHEQRVNPYVNRDRAFHYFFTRKVILAASAQAYVYFPGGFGTMDEFFEILTLVQTGKSEKVPIVLVGKEYWGGLMSWVEETVYGKFDAINQKDMGLFTVVDTAEEAFELIRDSEERTFF
ncbi:MAG: TIGR00730 family Rossman fold protein [Patescibacteria group bacterium]